MEAWVLMSHPALSIPKLSGVVTLAVHVLDMLEQSVQEYESVTESQSISLRGISEQQQKLVQELLVLQQEQDLALAQVCGEL